MSFFHSTISILAFQIQTQEKIFQQIQILLKQFQKVEYSMI